MKPLIRPLVCFFVFGSLNAVSAVTVSNVKNSTGTNLHRCKLFTACRQIKASFSGGSLNPYFCAYTHNGQFECPMTGSPPALPALVDSNCRNLVEQKPGITALDEFMYLSTADIESEVACVVDAILPTMTQNNGDFSSWFNNLFKISSGTNLTVNYGTSVTTLSLGILLSVLTLHTM